MSATVLEQGLQVEVVNVTPEMAEDWLGRNAHNRPVRQSWVNFLVGAIERGEWELNGDPIRFATNGNLLDGQHRLWAIFESQQTLPCLVIRGLPESTQETMDLGARRSLKDALALRGFKSPTSVAATANYWWRYTNGFVRHTASKPSIPQALQVLKENPNLLEAVRRSNKISRRFRISHAMLAVCVYEFSSIDGAAADDFFDALETGANLTKTNPVYVLRSYMELNAVGQGSKGTAFIHHALIIKAWNAYRDGRRIDRLNWRATGMNAEAFPEPH